MINMADNSSDLDYDDQECKGSYCEDNNNGTCTKDSDDYDSCEGKTGD